MGLQVILSLFLSDSHRLLFLANGINPQTQPIYFKAPGGIINSMICAGQAAKGSSIDKWHFNYVINDCFDLSHLLTGSLNRQLFRRKVFMPFIESIALINILIEFLIHLITDSGKFNINRFSLIGF